MSEPKKPFEETFSGEAVIMEEFFPVARLAMKVYVAVGGWNHEGYDLPIGVFSSEEKAKQAIAEDDTHYDGGVEITEYEIDKLTKWSERHAPKTT